jgi:hypothetical protein
VGTLARTIRPRAVHLYAIRVNDLKRSDKAISIPWQRLDEAGVLDVVAQGLAQFIHGSVNAVFKVYERIGGPEFLLDLFARHDFARPLKERGENLEGPLLQLDFPKRGSTEKRA